MLFGSYSLALVLSLIITWRCGVWQKSTMNGDMSFSELAKYPYQLLCRKTEIPDGIDPSHKEVFTSLPLFTVALELNLGSRCFWWRCTFWFSYRKKTTNIDKN